MFSQHRDVAFAHPERRQGDNLEAQPIQQVGAEPSLLRELRQILVRGRDDPDVDIDRSRRTDPRHFAVFDRAQQSLLRAHRQCSQFVEKQRAFVGFLETPGPSSGSTGEGTLLMTKQFRLDQRFRQSGAVQRHQWLAPSRGEPVEALGYQFLAGSALADDKHRTTHCGSATGALDCVKEGAGLAEELDIAIHAQLVAYFPKIGKFFLHVVGRKLPGAAEKGGLRKMARRLLYSVQHRNPIRTQTMQSIFSLRSALRRSSLDHAITASVLAMVAMNIVVLSQQFQSAGAFA